MNRTSRDQEVRDSQLATTDRVDMMIERGRGKTRKSFRAIRENREKSGVSSSLDEYSENVLLDIGNALDTSCVSFVN